MPGKGKDDEIIRLARKFTELHYRHDLRLDIDALHADIRRRVPIAAPPPLNWLQQVRISVSRARRQVPWDWRAPVRRPYAILLIFFLSTIVAIAVLFVHYPKRIAPENSSAQPVMAAIWKPSPVASSSTPVTTPGFGNASGAKSARGPQANNSTAGKLTLVGITLGTPSKSAVSLDVALAGQWSVGIGLRASLGVTIDPAEAVCRLQLPGNGNPDFSQLLVGLKTPINIKVETGPGNPLVVQISPTGIPSRPLNCSVLSSDAHLGRPAATSGTGLTTGTGGTDPTVGADGANSLSGTVGKILGAVTPISPSSGPTQSPSPEDVDPDPLPVPIAP